VCVCVYTYIHIYTYIQLRDGDRPQGAAAIIFLFLVLFVNSQHTHTIFVCPHFIGVAQRGDFETRRALPGITGAQLYRLSGMEWCHCFMMSLCMRQ